MTNMENNSNLDEIIGKTMANKVEELVPNFRKKNTLSNEQIEKIIQTISINLDIPQERVLVGMNLLFLQGAASAGAPLTMSIDLGGGKCIEKRNIIDACKIVTGNIFIRRIAETMALQIGKFAELNELAGELGFRINNKFKAETGENLTDKEMAFCSSFSQSIPNLDKITSERLARLLAEDYQIRFENKKKQTNEKGKNKGKKGK
jgi:hypothetical protein